MNLDDFQKHLNKIGKEARENERQMAGEISGEIFQLLDKGAYILYPAPEDTQSRLFFKMSMLGVMMEECLKSVPQDMAENGAIIITGTLMQSIFGR